MDVAYEELGSVLGDDPYSAYASRREHGTIVASEMRGGWDVVGFDTARAALKSHHCHVLQGQAISDLCCADDPADLIGLRTFQRCYLTESNTPEQQHLRRLIGAFMSAWPPTAFTRSRYASEIADVADRCCTGQQFDVVEDYIRSALTYRISEFSGLAVDDYLAFLGIARQFETLYYQITLEDGPDRALLERAERIYHQLGEFLLACNENGRASSPISLLAVLSQPREHLAPVNSHTLVALVLSVLLAYEETTIGLVGNTIKCILSQPPDQRLRNLDASVIADVIEETLRLESPVQLVTRLAAGKTKIGDQEVREGDFLWIWLGAANRDPAIFAHPDRFLLRRPVKHLAFGHGWHSCIGASVARSDGNGLINALLKRCKTTSHAVSAQWTDNIAYRRLHSLIVSAL